MIYEARWLHDDPAEMAHAILTSAQSERWEQERALAKEQARADFGLDRIVDAWVELLDAVTRETVPA